MSVKIDLSVEISRHLRGGLKRRWGRRSLRGVDEIEGGCSLCSIYYRYGEENRCDGCPFARFARKTFYTSLGCLDWIDLVVGESREFTVSSAHIFFGPPGPMRTTAKREYHMLRRRAEKLIKWI